MAPGTVAGPGRVRHPATYAVRLGLARGLIEFRQRLTNPTDVLFTLFWVGSFLAVLVLERGATLPGGTVPLPVATLPGMVALMVVSGGIIDVAGVLSTEREDGTLLRAKAVPNGIVGYLTARVVQSSLNVVAGALAILVLGLAVVPDLLGVPAARWLVLLGLIVFGLLATLPWGAVIGAVARTPATVFGLGMVPVMAVTAVSGVFYPITALPGWAQAVGQAFPMYWLGLGARAAVLPEAAVAAELGESWRTGPTLAVLGVWAVAGLVLAPGLLRRMARRESGTNLQERRDQAMQRYS